MWNNKKVIKMTGYTIEMLKDCLIKLSYFIESYLVPNKLKNFKLDELYNVTNIKESD